LPAAFIEIDGRKFLHFTCETCGAEASFGYGVGSITMALTANKPRLLGRWYCGAHRPEASAVPLGSSPAKTEAAAEAVPSEHPPAS
jgi:hypothetical protein